MSRIGLARPRASARRALGRLRGEGPATLLLLLLAGLGLAFFGLPILGLVLRVPWEGALARLTRPTTLDALRLSLLASLWATALALTFGFPLAWLLARCDFPGRAWLRALVMLPMVLPPVVAGVALLTAFGRRGLLGPWLSARGVELPFSTAGAVLAATFVAAPFLVVTLEAGLSSADWRLEEAAASLGASRWMILRTVTLPALRPSILAGAALAWARALGEFGATITFAGNLAGRTRTLPLAVFQALQSDPDAAVLLGALLMAVSLAVLVALRGQLLGGPARG